VVLACPIWSAPNTAHAAKCGKSGIFRIDRMFNSAHAAAFPRSRRMPRTAATSPIRAAARATLPELRTAGDCER
jgi:hypothetical protein